MRWNRRRSRLYRLLAQHERDKADREALEAADPGLPPWSDEQIDRLAQQVLRKEDER